MTHLESIIKSLSLNRMRLHETIENYKQLSEDLKQKQIHQAQIVRNNDNEDLGKMLEVIEDTIKKVNDILKDNRKVIHQISEMLSSHLYVHSSEEIKKSGFVAHIITVDERNEYDELTKTIKFNQKGYSEAPISNDLVKWRDASKVEVRPIRSELSK